MNFYCGCLSSLTFITQSKTVPERKKVEKLKSEKIAAQKIKDDAQYSMDGLTQELKVRNEKTDQRETMIF